MTSDERLLSDQFPRASQYHPEWVLANASGGANSLWLTEWLAPALDLRPGMRLLDLGCGRASSSIFLHREFGVQVWATDLWFSAAENIQRIRAAGVENGVFPIHADARSLPFAPSFFDAIVCIDSFYYYGTDDLYLNYLAQFVKPGAPIGIAGAGLVQEIEGELPEHPRAWWTQDLWALHSAAWLRRHWERTGIVQVELAETMPDGWKVWLDWHRAVAPDNATEIKAIEEDGGRFIGYVRVVGRRRGETKLEEYCWPNTLRSIPQQYTKKTLLRSQDNDKEPKQEDQPKHGDHKHAFTDPTERAKKWNDPERDKWQHPDEIVAAVPLKPGATVADIGAGTGYMVAHLSNAVGKSGTVIAIDAEAAMIEYLAKRSDDLGPAKIVPRKVGPDDPELQIASVDGVLTLDTWHHVKEREAYAKKVYEGLKCGGRFVVVEHEVDSEIGPPKAMRLEPASVTKQLEAAGFRVEVVRGSMPRHYMVVGHKD